MEDWLPEGHLARFVARIVDELDLSTILSAYGRREGRGKAAYHPVLLVRLLVYGYAIGQRSSRRIGRATYDEVPFRDLAAGQHPDHDTIAAFRQSHLEQLAQLFVQVLALCQRAGLIKLGQIAIDGTKIAANASTRKSAGYAKLTEREQRFAAEVEKLLQAAQTVDANEDAQFLIAKPGVAIVLVCFPVVFMGASRATDAENAGPIIVSVLLSIELKQHIGQAIRVPFAPPCISFSPSLA
jgi:transposase